MAIKPNLEVAAFALAKAIKSTRKFRKEEFETASATINVAYDADLKTDMAGKSADEVMTLVVEYGKEKNAAIARVSNVSQVRQELEKAGLVDGNTSKSAFIVEVEKAVDKIAERENAELQKMTAKK